MTADTMVGLTFGRHNTIQANKILATVLAIFRIPNTYRQ